jgi:hypothetical protein
MRSSTGIASTGFPFVACRRVRLLPEGGHPDPLAGTGIEDYAAASVAWVFRDATGEALAEAIRLALASHPQGMTRTEIRDHLGRNRSGAAIDAALAALAATGTGRAQRLVTAGRPAVLWNAVVTPH